VKEVNLELDPVSHSIRLICERCGNKWAIDSETPREEFKIIATARNPTMDSPGPPFRAKKHFAQQNQASGHRRQWWMHHDHRDARSAMLSVLLARSCQASATFGGKWIRLIR
jgi:hypothetical protein